ncbi:hypothetical protein Tco_0942108 [Tanacetum coccineum]
MILSHTHQEDKWISTPHNDEFCFIPIKTQKKGKGKKRKGRGIGQERNKDQRLRTLPDEHLKYDFNSLQLLKPYWGGHVRVYAGQANSPNGPHKAQANHSSPIESFQTKQAIQVRKGQKSPKGPEESERVMKFRTGTGRQHSKQQSADFISETYRATSSKR